MNNEINQIDDINYLRLFKIVINEQEMKNYYQNNNIKINDFYNGNIINPINKDYSTCQHYIHDLFKLHFIQQQ